MITNALTTYAATFSHKSCLHLFVVIRRGSGSKPSCLFVPSSAELKGMEVGLLRIPLQLLQIYRRSTRSLRNSSWTMTMMTHLLCFQTFQPLMAQRGTISWPPLDQKTVTIMILSRYSRGAAVHTETTELNPLLSVWKPLLLYLLHEHKRPVRYYVQTWDRKSLCRAFYIKYTSLFLTFWCSFCPNSCCTLHLQPNVKKKNIKH